MNTDIEIKQQDPFGTPEGTNDTNSVVQETYAIIANKAVDQNDTTKFVEDANLVTRDVSRIAHIDDTILKMSDTNFNEQSIVSFLSKPIKLASGTFNVTDSYSFLNNYSMPYAAFQSTQGILWREKLRGIFGIRMDMKFRIVINANRFQQGRYILGYVPLASPLKGVSSLKQLAFNNMHMATLVQRTTVPHVEFDLNTDTVAELEIPFISCRTFYCLASVINSLDEFPLGYLNLYPYSPLVSPAGSTTAGYTIYVSFSNVTLFGAASPQSGIQSKRHRNPQKEEISNSSNGPISSVSSALSKGFKEFANIPVLSTYANSISWVADRVTGVASIFGWSKPTQGDSLTKMSLYQGANHNVVDGDSDARAMSYLSKPGIVAMNGISGTDYDEMDFSYVTRKLAWFETDQWTTSDVEGTEIGSISITPDKFVTNSAITSFTPVGFVFGFFKLWRGSLRFRFKFVKTEFHSGRLEFAFFPTQAYGAALTQNSQYVHRNIVDIREHSELDIVIPFINDVPYSHGETGVLKVRVIDPLVAPATVSSTVTILIEICGGEDIEFAIPTTFAYTPTVVVPQSGLDARSIIQMNIGNSTIVADSNITSSLCIGDKISSFRSMLKRYTPIAYNDQNATGGVILKDSSITIFPDAISVLSAAIVADYVVADNYTLVASCYALTRGGVRIRNIINKGMFTGTQLSGPSMAKISSITRIFANSFTTPIISTTSTPTATAVNDHVAYQDLNVNAILSAEIPQYSKTYARSVCDQISIHDAVNQGYASGENSSTTNVNLRFNVPNSQVVGITSSNGNNVHNLFRAIADDADFSCFISVLPMHANPFVTGRVDGLV